MRTTQQFSITLPTEMAEAVKAKVASGEYATESEVIRDGLRTLLVRDQVINQWLISEVGPAVDALAEDPARVVLAAEIRARIATEHAQATAKSK